MRSGTLHFQRSEWYDAARQRETEQRSVIAHSKFDLGETRAMDVFPPAVRSEIMRRVRSKNTKPEVIVRQLVASMGYKYRLHAKHLPGHPDLAFTQLHKVIFVHGCFWHGHSCVAADLPASNKQYWEAKRMRNMARDRRVRRQLSRRGWKSLVVWECQTRKPNAQTRILQFLVDNK
jgi:DNA mismatch endonuclease (patch repair protein)